MKTGLLVLLIIFFQTGNLFSKVDYSKEWYTKDSKNFQIVFNAEQELLADKIIRDAERSYQALEKYFAQFPEKTILVLNDHTDLANGSAGVFPYPIINLHTAIPAYNSSIGEYGDWFYELILHEYVHILNLYPTNSMFDYLNGIFGSIARPNMLLPRWSTEGLAVALESKESNGGRLRSNYFHAYARALSLEEAWDDFRNPVELNETGIPSFPYGMRPYYFGAVYWEYLIRKKKDKAVLKFNENMAGTIPYFHNSAMKESNNLDDFQIFEKSYARLNRRALKQAKAIKTSPRLKEETLLANYNTHLTKRSPDGSDQLVIRKTAETAYELYSLNKDKVFLSADSIASYSWAPDSKSLLVSKLSTHKHIYSYFELMEYDLETKKSTSINKDLGIKEAVYNKSKERILAIQSRNGQESIILGKKIDGKWDWSSIVKFEIGSRASFIHWRNDQDFVYLLKNNSQNQRIYQRNIEDSQSTPLLSFLNRIDYLFTRDGQLFFISSHSGITAAYQSKAPFKTYKKLADTKTMIQGFEWDSEKQESTITELTAKGFKLKKIKSDLSDQKERKIKKLFYAKTSSQQSSEAVETSLTSKQKYSLTNQLAPKYWYPWISPIGDGLLMQVSTGGKDALGVHSYSLSVGYDSFTKEPSSSFSYVNQAFSWDTSLSYSKFAQNLVAAGTTISREMGSLGFANYLFDDSNKWKWSLSLIGDKNAQATDPNRFYPKLFLRYSDLGTQRGKQIGTPSGYRWGLGTSLYKEEVNTKSFQVFHWENSYFYSKSLPKHHSLQASFKVDHRSNNDTDIYASLVSGGGNFTDLGIPQFHLNRGYIFSQFLAWSMATLNLEYKFPLRYIYNGGRSFPLYLKKLYGTLVMDYSIMDGFYYNPNTNAYVRDEWKEGFATLGTEVSLETTIGYLLPVEYHFGLYYGFQKDASGELKAGLRISLPIF